MPIDWTPIILSIVALISTVIVTLIPIAVTAFTESHTAKLTQLKAIADKNQALAESIVRVIQNTKKAFTNSEKFALALLRLDEELHLPINTTRRLIEDAVSSLTLAFGDAWDALGGDTPDVPGPTTPETETTPTEELKL
jgi:hypothetical protein